MPRAPIMVADETVFHAGMVAAQEQEYTPNHVVHGIFFGTGDPESGGQHWNFTRNPGSDDDGVCTVKEIQQIVVYGGISSFEIRRTSIECRFDDEAARETGTRCLRITYVVDDQTWTSMCHQARLIFQGHPRFSAAP